jgi:lipid A disaccharide synthetase
MRTLPRLTVSALPPKEQRLLAALRGLRPAEVERLAAVLYDAVYRIDRSRF